MTPLLTEDGRPYGPIRYEQIVKECYLISKHINTSYGEVLDITPMERQMLLKDIADDLKKQNEQIEKIKAKNKK